MRRILSTLAAGLALVGCDALKPDTGALQSTTTQQLRPRCDACHGYPPNTGSHAYHIVTLAAANSGGPSGSGIHSITCYSCHSASIAHTDAGAMDSILFNAAVPDTFVETDTVVHAAYHTWGWPWKPLDRTQVRWNEILSSSDSLYDVPLGSPIALSGMVQPQWITRAASHPDSMGHLNGRIDVRFQSGANWVERFYANDGSDSLVVPHQAAYDPVRLSCGMVSCHGTHDNTELTKYVWGKTPTKPPQPAAPRALRTKP
jgi:hypothetical protein